jgi:hypothetical protein
MPLAVVVGALLCCGTSALDCRKKSGERLYALVEIPTSVYLLGAALLLAGIVGTAISERWRCGGPH